MSWGVSDHTASSSLPLERAYGMIRITVQHTAWAWASVPYVQRVLICVCVLVSRIQDCTRWNSLARGSSLKNVCTRGR
eukprot:7375858-Prymnesium_polylepis.2